MPDKPKYKQVVLQKPNGTAITYPKVVSVMYADAHVIVFVDEKFGLVQSNLPYQLKHDPLPSADEKEQK
ncbi:MAG TPA: hypothetical protein VED17_05345 [Nitrososphaerales archaeon]|nr:hypothetical protein [Nitrososphaerales archaeon]